MSNLTHFLNLDQNHLTEYFLQKLVLPFFIIISQEKINSFFSWNWRICNLDSQKLLPVIDASNLSVLANQSLWILDENASLGQSHLDQKALNNWTIHEHGLGYVSMPTTLLEGPEKNNLYVNITIKLMLNRH